ncbi:XkdX family protein [Mammaliicoccus sciuri]|nr:XkdX family protein [Mammaliicoccus sciuri]MDT0707371.1 XkdX family protein [Mammaliicoccus sciuri]
MKMLFPKFEDIKTMYGWSCYTNEQVKWFVDMEVIDKEEYALITGEKYPE